MGEPYHLEDDQGVESVNNEWYSNLQFVGEGGNAVTYLVVQTEGDVRGNPFALKIFKHTEDEERLERFIDELSFLRDASHPSILRYQDAGTYKGYPFLVSEYLPQTLGTVYGPEIQMTEKLSYSIQLLSALVHLSNLDPPVIHRDIKPANIFLKAGSCVLGDFGLMKRVDGAGDESGVWQESTEAALPHFYRSPDLVKYASEEQSLTPKSDVFQLGLVLAELYTGWNPAQRPKDDDPLSPVELNEVDYIDGRFGRRISELIERMLVTDPDERESAEELMDDWMGIFQDATGAARDLNGQVFS